MMSYSKKSNQMKQTSLMIFVFLSEYSGEISDVDSKSLLVVVLRVPYPICPSLLFILSLFSLQHYSINVLFPLYCRLLLV